jgi:hypothetical protein
VTTVGQVAVQSFGELSGKKSSQPIDGSSKDKYQVRVSTRASCRRKIEVPLNQVELEERYCKTAIRLSAASASLQPGYPVGHGDHRIFR